MYNSLNPRWASTILGGFAVLLVPVPFVLTRYVLYLLPDRVSLKISVLDMARTCEEDPSIALLIPMKLSQSYRENMKPRSMPWLKSLILVYMLKLCCLDSQTMVIPWALGLLHKFKRWRTFNREFTH